jgi:hypothetical protein
MKLNDLCASRGVVYDVKAMDEIFHQTREAAFESIQRKGATYYAVATGIMRLTEAIFAQPKHRTVGFEPCAGLLWNQRCLFESANGRELLWHRRSLAHSAGRVRDRPTATFCRRPEACHRHVEPS